MIRSAAVARLKRGLDFRLGTVDDTNIVAQLQESQRLLEKGRDLPRWLRQEDATLTVPSGSANVSLPTGFLREVHGEGLRYVNSDGDRVYLEKVSMEEGLIRFEGYNAGAPIAYAIRKASFTFFPERDVEYSLTWSYYKADDVLSADSTENAWLANNPEALIGHAGLVYAADLGNAEAVQRFTRMFNEAWGAQFAEDIERDLDNDPIEMGGRL